MPNRCAEAASAAPRPMTEHTMMPSTAVTLPSAATSARRAPAFTLVATHISTVGPRVTVSTNTAAA